MGVQAAYLSLSRGEGGQNLIGPELGPELGIIRTEELLAARQLDGARQFFTRAYDFGYSKTAEETFRFWPRDSLLADVLSVMRRFRPPIVATIFPGTPRIHHGRAAYVALVDTARALLNPSHPAAIVPVLARALHALGSAPADTAQRAPLEVALATAAGVSLDGVTDDGIVVGGERLQIEATVWNAGDSTIRLDSLELQGPPGWVVERLDAAASPVARGAVATRRFAVTVAPDAPRSQPYFLRRPLAGALYDWTGVPAEWRGLPLEPPLLQVAARVVIAGEPVTLSREVVYRFRDQAIGEVRRPIFVTQPFDVRATPDL